MRVLAWNLERKRPTTPTGQAGVTHLQTLAADVVVLTEGRLSFPAADGHLVASQTWGHEDERKVVMWSRQPWRDLDTCGPPGLPPGRFVAATTDGPDGPVRMIGVCISWHMANVRYGSGDRKPWQDHIRYCEALGPYLASPSGLEPIVVAGDFNQRLPSPRPTRREARALAAALSSVEVLTAGDVSGWESPGIDHIAVRGLAARRVWGWPQVVGGVRCSDHSGCGADLIVEEPHR